MIRLKEYEPETLERYFSRIIEFFDISYCWRVNLAQKAEAGSTRSEKGYQMIAASTARAVAEALGYSAAKAEVISRCIGIGFPRGGKEGMQAIAETAGKLGIEINAPTLGVESAMEYISSRLFVATALDTHLREYCSDTPTEAIVCPEVRVVRICQEMLERVKRAEYHLGVDGGKLLYDSSAETKAASKQAGVPTLSPTLCEKTDALPPIPPRMTAEEKAAIQANAEGFANAFHGIDGLYKYITTDGQ